MNIEQIPITKIVEKGYLDANKQPKIRKEQISTFRKIRLASNGQRLFHYILDSTLISLLHFRTITYALSLPYEFGFYHLDFISATLFYYLLFEITLQSTPGKLILGNVVINDRAEKTSTTDILVRTLIRFVPFDGISFVILDRGWHDKWAKTYVVSKKEKCTLQKLLKEHHSI